VILWRLSTEPIIVNESNDLKGFMMQVLSANDAKTQLGNMLMKVQRALDQINKNSKPLAVVISVE
jgi:prevent-host-death family protein